MAKEIKAKSALAEKRREAIMDAALELFLDKGYASVSVDEIIQKSGGSKSSVYEYFGTKDGLFREIVTSVSNEIMNAMEVPGAKGQGAREVLTLFGEVLCTHVLTKKGIGLFRLAVSSSKRFPKLARMFYESGPLHGQLALTCYLEKEAAAGRVNIENPRRAAEFFFGMLLVKDHIAMPLGCAPPPSKAAIREMVKEAVDVFMAAYGV